MSVLTNLMRPCWVNNNFRVIPCLPNHCIRAPLRHISPIVLPDAVYQKLNYSLFIACFSLLGSCETHKMPALYALTQHQCSDITTLVWKPLHYQSDELQKAESTVSHSMTQSAASLAVTAEPNEYFTFPRFSVVNTDINFSVLIRFGWFEWIFFPPEQLFLGPSTFRGQDAIWFLLTRTPRWLDLQETNREAVPQTRSNDTKRSLSGSHGGQRDMRGHSKQETGKTSGGKNRSPEKNM